MYILGQLALVCLVICFAELVYGLFGQSKMDHTIYFC